ncbi:hypothetical protein ACC771_24710, partial [Rhizobium ruizarguesonis]
VNRAGVVSTIVKALGQVSRNRFYVRACRVARSSACRHLLPEGRRDLRQPLRSSRDTYVRNGR